MKYVRRYLFLVLFLLLVAVFFLLRQWNAEAWSALLEWMLDHVELVILAFIGSVAGVMWSLGLKMYTGMAFLALGTLALLLLHIYHITFVNRLLLIPLIFVLLGTVLHVWAMKNEKP